MADAQGDFIAYDLLTTDPEKVGAFYGAVVGWAVQEPRVVDVGRKIERRSIKTREGDLVAGIVGLADDATTRPGWLGYVAVADVDAAAAAILAAGGRLHVAPTSVDGVGRLAMVADPQGVVFYIMRRDNDQASTGFSLVDAGHCSWNELATTDPEAAVDFYRAQFDWSDGGVMPMGAAGDYRFIRQGDATIGAIMTRGEGMPAQWLFYFRVDDLDAALNQVEQGGGKVIHGPVQVPGGDSILICLDPAGAGFGLTGKRGAGN